VRRGAAEAAGAAAVDAAAAVVVPVWDPFVRLFHWSVAAACLLDLFVLDTGRWPHRWVGYFVWGAVAARAVWGFAGPRHARFADFVPGPAELVAYVRALARGEEPRHLGHNPLGALMILFLLALLCAICLTGWMQRTDRFFGTGWVEETHTFLSDALIVAVLVHAAAAVATSVRHRENLVWAMVTGRKKPL
jgi:cytochrome b